MCLAEGPRWEVQVVPPCSGDPPALVTAEPSGLGLGLWGLSSGAGEDWLPWRTRMPGWAMDIHGSRPVQRLESQLLSICSPVAPCPDDGHQGWSFCGPRREPRSGRPAGGRLGACPPDLCLRPGPRAVQRRPGLPFLSPLQTEFSSHSSRRADLGTHFPQMLLWFPGRSSEGESMAWLPPALGHRQEMR